MKPSGGLAPPEIAVVIPTFNRRPVLERALRSALGQRGPEFEVIVVDDGSTDGTFEYVAGIEDQRLFVVHQENQGVCVARNSGLAKVTAPFVTFLDSDDEALEGWLEHFAAGARTGHQIVSCAAQLVSSDQASEVVTPEPGDPAFGYLPVVLLAGAFAISTELLRNVGAFRAGLRYSEHTDLGLRLGHWTLSAPIPTLYSSRPFVRLHRGDRTYDPSVRHESALVLLGENREQMERSPRVLATYLTIAGVAAQRLGRSGEARTLFVTAIRTRPTVLTNYVRLASTLLPARVVNRIVGASAGLRARLRRPK